MLPVLLMRGREEVHDDLHGAQIGINDHSFLQFHCAAVAVNLPRQFRSVPGASDRRGVGSVGHCSLRGAFLIASS